MDNIEIYKEKINLALKAFLDKKLKEDGKYSKEIKELIENVIEYNMRGGKRIRPVTIIFAYKCFSSGDEEKIIRAAISLELMQAFLLIHDDIIDKSDIRRGKETLHKIYGKENKDFGINMAILAGDLCCSYTYDSISKSGFPDKEKNKAIEYLSWIINREVYGQTLDIVPGFSDLTEEDVLKIYELKTATYTVQGPIYLGCLLAGAPQDKIKKLQEYAKSLGIAFQLQDDLNGVFSGVDKLGKPNDSDIKEGKKTLLIVKALELSDKKDKDFLLKNYGNNNVSEESIEIIREIIKKCGAYDYCVNKFKELILKSKGSIADVPLLEEGKKYLLEMADYIGGLF
jgi:geranylgeranyl diphosphate synthase, type I